MDALSGRTALWIYPSQHHVVVCHLAALSTLSGKGTLIGDRDQGSSLSSHPAPSECRDQRLRRWSLHSDGVGQRLFPSLSTDPSPRDQMGNNVTFKEPAAAPVPWFMTGGVRRYVRVLSKQSSNACIYVCVCYGQLAAGRYKNALRELLGILVSSKPETRR